MDHEPHSDPDAPESAAETPVPFEGTDPVTAAPVPETPAVTPPAADDDHRGAWSALREGVVLVALALGLAVLIRSFLVQAFYVPSGSMEPTLQENDRILVSKITTDLNGVERGQVVVFRDPSDWLDPPVDTSAEWQRKLRSGLTFIGLLPSDRGDDLVKRVIGIGGDRVFCCDDKGRITVNGKALDEESYIAPGAGTAQYTFDVVVPKDHLWVMGDNRGGSEDSRPNELKRPGNGMVPVDNVVGRVVAVIFPIKHWATLPVPDTFHDVPDPSPSPTPAP